LLAERDAFSHVDTRHTDAGHTQKQARTRLKDTARVWTHESTDNTHRVSRLLRM
jgi:hypothetical protein